MYRIENFQEVVQTATTSIVRNEGGKLELDQLQASRDGINRSFLPLDMGGDRRRAHRRGVRCRHRSPARSGARRTCLCVPSLRRHRGALASLVWTVPCIAALGAAIVLKRRRDPAGVLISVGLSGAVAIIALSATRHIENIGWLVVWAALSLPSAWLASRLVHGAVGGANLNRYPRRRERKKTRARHRTRARRGRTEPSGISAGASSVTRSAPARRTTGQ